MPCRRAQPNSTASGTTPIDIAQVIEYVLVETDYSEMSHLKKRTLGPMEKEGPAVLSVERPTGKRKRPGEYPDGTRLRFGG